MKEKIILGLLCAVIVGLLLAIGGKLDEKAMADCLKYHSVEVCEHTLNR